jgi:hypothetical protein
MRPKKILSHFNGKVGRARHGYLIEFDRLPQCIQSIIKGFSEPASTGEFLEMKFLAFLFNGLEIAFYEEINPNS